MSCDLVAEVLSAGPAPRVTTPGILRSCFGVPLSLQRVPAMEPKKSGGYKRPHTSNCCWCGKAFNHVRPIAVCCKQRCRMNYYNFRKLTGYLPDTPPGEVTTGTAYEAEVERLLAQERERRAALIAEGKLTVRVARHTKKKQ